MRLRPLDGLTPEQRFFVGFAQWACANQRPEHLRVNAITNPHSPPKYRINGVVVNMPEFAQAFQCKAEGEVREEAGRGSARSGEATRHRGLRCRLGGGPIDYGGLRCRSGSRSLR